jgi:deoxyribonuclease I
MNLNKLIMRYVIPIFMSASLMAAGYGYVSRDSPSLYPTPNIHWSFSSAKKKLQKIYQRGELESKTFYCDCDFDPTTKEPVPDSCGYVPRKSTNSRSKRIEWEHVVPAHRFGHDRECWTNDDICPKGKAGRKCCGKIDEEFKHMEADMMNLYPAIGELNGDRSNYPFGDIEGEERNYGQCDFERLNRIVEPTPEIRGDIARKYFYFENKWNMALTNEERSLFNKWNENDPIDENEIKRINIIIKYQE